MSENSSFEETNVLSEEEFYQEFTTRNQPILGTFDQRRIKESTILVAGCGSIGGAAVEPLVRAGFTNFILADPGVYELNNLNRQNATISDIGFNKAEVMAARALSINPHVNIEVYADGVTADNIVDIFDGVDLVVDGVDVTTAAGLQAKDLLHRAACLNRVPLFTGWDMSSTQCVCFYDYRSSVSTPFDGDLGSDSLGDLPLWVALARLVPLRSVPNDMITLVCDNLDNEDFHFPQLVQAADQFGAIAVSHAIKIVLGGAVPRNVVINLLDVSMTRKERLWYKLKRGWKLLLLLRAIRRLR